MTTEATFTTSERARASAWKAATPTLPEAARVPAPYVGKTGSAGRGWYEYCLPAQFAPWSLLPEVRAAALELFAELGVPWHAGVGDGPSNHLLSSQVQCVNALGQMVNEPERIVRAFGPFLGTTQVEQIEPGRWLTFEYIGAEDHLHEAVHGRRTRGAHCTSVDAAFVHLTRDHVRELVLVEWKYTERYGPRAVNATKDETRFARYGHLLADPNGPIRSDVLGFDDLLQEPFYQLVRQQLLAHELEKTRAHGAERVRIVHVMPAENLDYQTSLHESKVKAVGSRVDAVWHQLLRHHDRFTSIDSALFADAEITSPEYVARYGSTSR